MQGREGGKEKNMMSSLRTHLSELSGCSESAIYFINIIPSGLTSRLPQQPFPKLPVLFLCLKAAHAKEKGLTEQELGAAVTRGIIPFQTSSLRTEASEARHTQTEWGPQQGNWDSARQIVSCEIL